MERLGEEGRLLAYLAVAAGLKLVAAYRYTTPRRSRRQVGRVSGLTIYPIKSARAVNVQEAECNHAGLKMIRENPPVADRFWMVTTDTYEPVTLMDFPKMALVSVGVSQDDLLLSAPNQEPFTLPLSMPAARQVSVSIQNDTVSGRDCGDAVADWVQRAVGVAGARLVYYPQEVSPKVRASMQHKLAPQHGVAYAWSCPILLIAEESMQDLNTKLLEPTTMETMRPNIIVEGAIPYEEEEWTKASIGPVTFEVAKLCDRCRTVNVDISKGERYNKGTGPLDTLRMYRPLKKEHGYRPILGIKYMVTNPGVIRIGDPVFVEE